MPSTGGAGGCARFEPPGYDGPTQNATNFRFLYRRSLDPSDTTLVLVKAFVDADAVIEKRAVAFDPARGHFLIVAEGYDRRNSEVKIERLSELSLPGGAETILSETRADISREPWERFRSALFVARGSDSLYETFRYYLAPSTTLSFVRRSLDGTDEIPIEEVRGTEPISVPIAATGLRESSRAPTSLMIPVVGDATGANSHSWRSDVWIFNPEETTTTVTLQRLSNGQQLSIVLGAHETRVIRRALLALGGGGANDGGDGVTLDALTITPDAAGLAVTSRTYTPAPKGEYSQVVPSVPGGTGNSTHLNDFSSDLVDESTQSAFILDKRTSAVRHNLGITNTTSRPVTVIVRYGTLASGRVSPELERAISVQAHTTRIVTVEHLFSEDVMRDRPPRLAIAADAAIPIWLSMVDNVSGDATFVPNELYTFRPDGSRLSVPVLDLTGGWDADLIGQFPSAPSTAPSDPVVSYYGNSCLPQTATLRGVVGNQAVVDDLWSHSIFPAVATQLRACDLGSLQIPAATWMAGFLRMYAKNENGTVTDRVPLFPLHGWAAQDFPVDLPAHSTARLSLLNGDDSAASYIVSIFDDRGALVAGETLTLQPRELAARELRTTFALSDGLYGVSVRSSNGSGVWATVTVRDEQSGDRSTW